MKKYHGIDNVKFSADDLILKVDGKQYAFRLSDISHKLAAASKIEREKYVISPSGYGIRWPLIDEDLSIDGLLGIQHTPSKARKTVSP